MLLLRPTRPLYYRGQRQADLPPFFRALLAYMAVGGVLHVRHEASERAFRFRKVSGAGEARGIRLELPDAPGTRQYGDRVASALAAGGFRCVRPPRPDRLWPAPGPALAAVEGLGPIEAFRVAELVRGAMGLDPDARFTVHLEGPRGSAQHLGDSRLPDREPVAPAERGATADRAAGA